MRFDSVPSAAHAAALVPAPAATVRWASGLAALDAALGGGFARGRLHEFYAAEEEDEAAAAGFAMALVSGMAGTAGTALWLRSRQAVRREGVLQAGGWRELGGDPARCLFGVVAEPRDLLRAAVDALRSGALAALVIEAPGRLPELDLTASRRLMLAAQGSGTTLLVLRGGAEPVPSAAETRWRVAAAPSRALAANAPGAPVFAIELLRQRAGRSGLSWHVEWDRDRYCFRDATLSGAALPVPADRTVARGTAEARRRVA